MTADRTPAHTADHASARTSAPDGTVESLRSGVPAGAYDHLYAALDWAPVLTGLWAEAWGDQYPAEVAPFGSCSWWVLGQAVAALRMPRDGLLADLGCGRGGPGLWLARATGARLHGVDFSKVAVELAGERVPDFLQPGRAAFTHATVERTGLPDRVADGLVSFDALNFTTDLPAALREVARVLAPTGRAVITATERPDGQPPWADLATGAGLVVTEQSVNPHHDEPWRRLYALYRRHAGDLRVELGTAIAEEFLAEAAVVGPALGRRAMLLLVLGPAGPAGGAPARTDGGDHGTTTEVGR